MPMRVYECSECESSTMQIFSIPEKVPSVTPCSKCGAVAHLRPALPSFVLKGDGWGSSGYTKKGQK